MQILVTGGAGFIGSHLVKALAADGHAVRVLDSFVEQVHGTGSPVLDEKAEVVRGDVRDAGLLARALEGVEVVFHEAAEVGVGQSMYDIQRYVGANTLATAVLLEALLSRRDRIRRLVVASSMSIYGEGAYACRACGPVAPPPRPLGQLQGRRWEMECPTCAADLQPMPTPETKPLDPASVYAITKQDQEQLCLTIGRAYRLPTVALRYFNVYGPGQALSNPYTGVAAIFSGRLLNGQSPLIFEDGLQTRDFVHVDDIVRANLLVMNNDAANYQVVNVGTGRATSIRRIAELIADGLGVEIGPTVVGRFREGDIRHCVADITRARSLGYEPAVPLERGMSELIGWVRGRQAVSGIDRATAELESRGLLR
jgi:dTDP-L-rhamnose 4-epimerase